ncbi:MAG: hypothetical protein KME18_21370 [Phormidium tanganyikae FI6-MK23]|jgi:hypothetical protein|nr:hypothetical protein [Phormidium tanganyikae FI6-MK23]
MQAICDDFEVELPIVRARTCVAERSHFDLEGFPFPSELRDALIAVAKHVEKASVPSQPSMPIAIATDHFSKSQPVPQENYAIFVDDADLLGNLE